MEELQFRKTMGGGYKREDVMSYIASLVKKYEEQLKSAKEDVDAAKAEAEAAGRENARLFEKLQRLEEDRDSVSRAVISAQKEADAILHDAKTKGEALVNEKQAEVDRMETVLVSLRSEIRSLRLGAAAALRKYEAALGEITPDAEDDEEE